MGTSNYTNKSISRKLEMIPSWQLKTESENRTIYVEKTGNDKSGDGSQIRPFATIQRAIRNIGDIISNCSITVQMGAGTWEVLDAEFVELHEKYYQKGNIFFKGTTTIVEDNYNTNFTQYNFNTQYRQWRCNNRRQNPKFIYFY